MLTLTTEEQMACTSGCPTKDHQSYADCLRSKSARVAYANTAGGWDYSTQKKWDKDLDAYKDARAQGIQPAGTGRASVDRALAISNESGVPYQA